MLSMTDVQAVLSELTPDEKAQLHDRIKTFLGYKDEIVELRESMKEQVKAAKGEIKSINKQDTAKIFSYFRKNDTPQKLRADANAIEELHEAFK